MAWFAVMGAESVAYHEENVLGRVNRILARWKQPAMDLAHIQVAPERCFEEPSAGPRWSRSQSWRSSAPLPPVTVSAPVRAWAKAMAWG